MANRGINKVILIGYLGQEPEVRYMTNGNVVTNISMATTESWKDKQTGEFKEKTEWHRIVLFGKLAEISSEYLHKGSQVYIEGSLRTRKWKNQEGQDRYVTEVVVSVRGVMQILNNSRLPLEQESDTTLAKVDNDNHNNNNSNKSCDESNSNFDEDDIPF